MLIAEGSNVAVDILGEAKMARREAAENAGSLGKNAECDAALAALVRDVAGLSNTLAEIARNASEATIESNRKTAALFEKIAETMNNTISITNNYQSSPSASVASASAASKLGVLTSCWEYKAPTHTPQPLRCPKSRRYCGASLAYLQARRQCPAVLARCGPYLLFKGARGEFGKLRPV